MAATNVPIKRATNQSEMLSGPTTMKPVQQLIKIPCKALASREASAQSCAKYLQLFHSRQLDRVYSNWIVVDPISQLFQASDSNANWNNF